MVKKMQGYVINQPDHALRGGPGAGRPVNLLHGTRVLVGAGLPRLCQRCAVSTQLREAVCRESRYWSPKVLAVHGGTRAVRAGLHGCTICEDRVGDRDMIPTMYRGRWLLDGSASWGTGRVMAAPDPEAGAELRLRGATEDRCVPVRRTA
jgi:hypothetical protein